MVVPTTMFVGDPLAGYNGGMDQGINSSFIPKKEVEVRRPRRRRSSLTANLFLLIAVVIFLTALLASLFIYLWGRQLDAENSRALETLEKNRDSYGISAIEEFIDITNRLKSAELLLQNHVNVSGVFSLLEEDTLTDVYLTNFNFNTESSQVLVSARGFAPTYAHVALQADQYSANNLINDLILSGVNQAREGGVQFDLNFAIDRDVLTVTN